ncbi:uncharacterized protein FMAN_06488 [Fusarium mangiferae]|uniref:Ubiquitin-like domain-containing protein n=1 Tax=Fusarium mangiferae TaxID=192010 RepID=A0A1L7SHY4_FUSMA|nr:uncharacterized protein FMAN_06488 [Fusarium mangiferae]CVK86131.1 uncharacterized protein FMAN_06488 [Fusarium mangiferae]
MNALSTIQNQESPTQEDTTNDPFANHFRVLITTTETTSRDIKTYLLEHKARPKRLVRLMVATSSTRVKQEGTLSLMEQNAEKSSVRLFTLTEHLERWIKTAVTYCNGTIGLVWSNAHILLPLHNIVRRLESAMSMSVISIQVLEFENPFSITMALPYQMRDTWEGLCRLLVVMFSDKPGRFPVEQKRFVVMHPQINMPITQQNWSTSAVPGVSFDMFILVERLCNQSAKFFCPRCDHVFDLTTFVSNGGYQLALGSPSQFHIVVDSHSWLEMSPMVNYSRWGISSDSSSLTVLVPLLNLYTGTRGMDSEDRDPETHRRFRDCKALWTFSLFAVFTSFHSRGIFRDLSSEMEFNIAMPF